MQPRLGRSQRDAEGVGNVGERHAEIDVHDHEGSPIGLEGAESTVEQIPLGDGGGGIARIGNVCLGQLHLDCALTSTTRKAEAGVDRQPVEPGIPAVRVAEAGKVPPRPDEGLLDGVPSELWVPEDEASGLAQPSDGRAGKHREGVMIASLCQNDETSLVHGRLSCGATRLAALARVWFAPVSIRSIAS